MRVGRAFHDIQSLLEKARLLTFSSIFDEKFDNLAIEPVNFVMFLKKLYNNVLRIIQRKNNEYPKIKEHRYYFIN